MTDEESPSGSPTVPISSADLGRRFERKFQLGKGGAGTVELAFDRLLRRPVALKTLREDAPEAERRDQFLHEARLTAELEHGNIVPMYDVIARDPEESLSLMMKYVDGETYQQLIEQLHASPTSEKFYAALGVFLKVCDAIAFAHERGIIHCDLKPENIMVGGHGQVHVMDWGVARRRAEVAPDHDASRSQARASSTSKPPSGTLAYMAPEQLEGNLGAINATTDIYGLGGLLCVLITGEPPRRGVEDVADTQLTPSFEDRRPAIDVPPELCRIAERALHAAQAYRFQSVEELKAEVESFMAGGGWFGTQHYLAGNVIIREGDIGSEAFIITSGVCDVFKRRSDGSQQFLRSMGPGETFGELAVLMRRKRSASVVAKSDVSLRVVTPDALERELDRNPILAAFLSAVTSRFCELEASLEPSDP